MKKKMKPVPVQNKDLTGVKTVTAHYDELEDWSMDKKGYFLIKVDRRSKKLVVAHCKKLGYIDLVIEGKKPQDIYYEAHKRKLFSRADHAAYLGKELEKAYIAMKLKKKYVQDSPLL